MTQEKHEISELLTLLAATEYLYKQGTADHVPLDQRYYHPEGRHIGPRKGRFSIIGVETDPHGNPLGQLVPALAPGMENESVRTWIEKDPEAQHVLNTLSQYGNPYVVGGGVRDALLGVPSKDVDIEVYGLTIDELSDIVQKDFGGKQDQVGKVYGVFKVGNFDISLPRTETKVGDKHTDFDVEPNPDLPPELAARRRDFTINALMYDYKNDQVLDFFGGIQDLEAKRIKHVSPETFVEDPLRVYRAAQFAARFDFSIDPSTVELARSMDLSEISNERVFGEFEKLLLKSSTPSTGMQALDDMGVLDAQFPEISALKNTHQRSDFHAEGDVFTHTKMTLDKAAEIIQRFPDQKDKTIIMLAALCHDLGKATTTTPDGRAIGHEVAGVPITEEFLGKLTNDRDILATVPSLVENHLKPLQFHRDGASDAAFRRLINKHGTEYLNLLSAVSEADVSGRLVGYPDGSVGEPGTEENVWFRDKVKQVAEKAGGLKGGKIAPLITGKDLKNLGLKEGKELGSILRDVQKRQEEGEITSADEALDYVRNNYQLPYQLPEYDTSWETFLETKDDNIGVQILLKKDSTDEEWAAKLKFPLIMGDGVALTDTIVISATYFTTKAANQTKYLSYGGTNFAAITQNLVNSLMLSDSYEAPKISESPSWAKNMDDPFPELPDVDELHIDDLPGFYKLGPDFSFKDMENDKTDTGVYDASTSYLKPKKNYRLGENKIAQGLVKQIRPGKEDRAEGIVRSENISFLWSSPEKASQGIERQLELSEGSISPEDAENVAAEFKKATATSLEARGLPQKFYVFRGGRSTGDENTPTSVSLRVAHAAAFAGFGSRGKGWASSYLEEGELPGEGSKQLEMYEVDRDDILLDMGAVVPKGRVRKVQINPKDVARMGEGFKEIEPEEQVIREQEFLVRNGALKNVRKIIIPRTPKTVGDSGMAPQPKQEPRDLGDPGGMKFSDDLPELLTLLTATEFLFKQGVTPSQEWTTGFVPPEKRFYHLEGTHKGPRGGQFSIIGTEVDQHGASLQQAAQAQPPGPHDISELPMPPQQTEVDPNKKVDEFLVDEKEGAIPSLEGLLSEEGEAARQKYIHDNDDKALQDFAGEAEEDGVYSEALQDNLRRIVGGDSITLYRGAPKGKVSEKPYVGVTTKKSFAEAFRNAFRSPIPKEDWTVIEQEVNIDDIIAVGAEQEGELIVRGEAMQSQPQESDDKEQMIDRGLEEFMADEDIPGRTAYNPLPPQDKKLPPRVQGGLRWQRDDRRNEYTKYYMDYAKEFHSEERLEAFNKALRDPTKKEYHQLTDIMEHFVDGEYGERRDDFGRIVAEGKYSEERLRGEPLGAYRDPTVFLERLVGGMEIDRWERPGAKGYAGEGGLRRWKYGSKIKFGSSGEYWAQNPFERHLINADSVEQVLTAFIGSKYPGNDGVDIPMSHIKRIGEIKFNGNRELTDDKKQEVVGRTWAGPPATTKKGEDHFANFNYYLYGGSKIEFFNVDAHLPPIYWDTHENYRQRYQQDPIALAEAREDRVRGHQTVVHELAHAVYFNLPMWFKSQVQGEYIRAVQSNSGFISQYAKSGGNDHEFFSECYAAYFIHTKELEKRNPTMHRMMEQLFKNVPEDRQSTPDELSISTTYSVKKAIWDRKDTLKRKIIEYPIHKAVVDENTEEIIISDPYGVILNINPNYKNLPKRKDEDKFFNPEDWEPYEKEIKKSDDLPELLTLLASTEYLAKQGEGSEEWISGFVPAEKRKYSPTGTHKGPRKGRFDIIGAEVDAQGNVLQAQARLTPIEIPDSYTPGQYKVNWRAVDKQMIARDTQLKKFAEKVSTGPFRFKPWDRWYGIDDLYKERLVPSFSKRREHVNGYNSQEVIPLMDHPDPEVAQHAFLRYKAASILGSDFINYFAENLSMPEGGLEEFEKAFPQSTFHDQTVAGLRDVEGDDPTLRLTRIVDELYSNTEFSTIHRLSKDDWESNSTTGYFSWAIQESVGRQFDGDVQFFMNSTLKTAPEAGMSPETRIKYTLDQIMETTWDENELGAKPTQDDIDKYVRVHKALSRWMLDAAFPDTDTLTVYRGTSADEIESDGETQGPHIGEEAILGSNPLTSWSLKPHVAFQFAADASGKNWLLSPQAYDPYADEMYPKAEPASTYDKWLGKGWENRDAGPNDAANELVILKTEISKDDIFSHFGSYAYKGNENEILAINSPDRRTQIWDFRHEAHQMAVAKENSGKSDGSSYGYYDLTNGLPLTLTQKRENELKTMNLAREWGREQGSVHPRIWAGMDSSDQKSIDPSVSQPISVL